MSIRGVCVDQARVISKTPTGTKVEGSTVYTETQGTWFRCRLTLQDNKGQDDQATGVRVQRKNPKLLYVPKDTAGAAVVLNVEDRLEVSSVQLGDTVWEVAGDPTPLRKKRSVIGFEVELQKTVRIESS